MKLNPFKSLKELLATSAKDRFVPPSFINAPPIDRMRAKLITVLSGWIGCIILIIGTMNILLVRDHPEVPVIFAIAAVLATLPTLIVWKFGKLKLAASVMIISIMVGTGIGLFAAKTIIFPGYIWFVTLGSTAVILMGIRASRGFLLANSALVVALILWNSQYGFESVSLMTVRAFATRSIMSTLFSMLFSYLTLKSYEEVRISAEEEIRRTVKDLQIAKSQGQLGIVASGMAHEINNPLTIISGAAWKINRMAKSGSINAADIQAASELITQRSAAISVMLRELLQFTTLTDQGKFSPTELNDLVTAAVTKHAKFAEEREIVVLKDNAPGIYASVDKDRLQYSIEQIIDNGIKATKAHNGKNVTIKIEQTASEIEIWVIDEGPGIPENQRESLFTPFYTTRSPGQGRGLGLSAAYHIAQAHGGTIRFHDVSPTQHAVIMVIAKGHAEDTSEKLPIAS